jgi:hypothetical protein
MDSELSRLLRPWIELGVCIVRIQKVDTVELEVDAAYCLSLLFEIGRYTKPGVRVVVEPTMDKDLYQKMKQLFPNIEFLLRFDQAKGKHMIQVYESYVEHMRAVMHRHFLDTSYDYEFIGDSVRIRSYMDNELEDEEEV